MLANLGLNKNPMYRESNKIEAAAKYYVFLKRLQVLGGGGNFWGPEKKF